MNAKIQNISVFLPSKVFSNEDFFREFPEERKNKNLLKVGVTSRYIVEEGKTASDLGFLAAEKFFEDYGVDRNEVDFLIFNSVEQDYYTPQVSCLLQDRLKLRNDIGTVDILHGCSGFTYSLLIAKGIVESGQAKKLLLINSSTLTKTLNPKDRSSRFVFGDAATATLIVQSEKEAIGNFGFGTNGASFRSIILEDGYGRNKISEQTYKEVQDSFGNISSRGNLRMDGIGIFLFSIKEVPELIKKVLMLNGKTIDDIDFFVLHQANAFLLETIQKKLRIPSSKMVIEMETTGNTVPCTIPIALKYSMEKGRILPGHTVLIAGFGTGLSWSGTIIEV